MEALHELSHQHGVCAHALLLAMPPPALRDTSHDEPAHPCARGEDIMTTARKPLRQKRTTTRTLVAPQVANAPYRVGPGFPPREFQFQPGQSGNPKGARKRPPSIAPDLKALLQAALSKKITLSIGDKERILTKAAAGIEQLVEQFARGDRYARRDLFDLADKLGLDLAASSKAALKELAGKELAAEDKALVADFLKRNALKSGGDEDGQRSADKVQDDPNMKGQGHDEPQKHTC
jgi:hypothetical protein